jgi:hypothetical protein
MVGQRAESLGLGKNHDNLAQNRSIRRFLRSSPEKIGGFSVQRRPFPRRSTVFFENRAYPRADRPFFSKTDHSFSRIDHFSMQIDRIFPLSTIPARSSAIMWRIAGY